MNGCEPSRIRETLRALFDAALAAADPARAIAGHLPQPVAGRTIVVGAGKAAACNVMSSAVQGNSPTYTLRRLKRDRPRHCEDAGRTSSTATAMCYETSKNGQFRNM